MNNKKNNDFPVWSIVFLSYLPISILSSFYYICKGTRFSIFIFSFLIATLGFLLIPYDSWDMTRHYYSFHDISKISFDEIKSYGQSRYYFFYIYFLQMMKQLFAFGKKK